ncbi:MAG: HlyD family secretion protein [Planctomycetaceae bacterium]|nr:HlyD family secretion protein [Planctomycetaceae bacterium]
MKISASGTVEPEEFVDVGAQVAGKIIEFGTEPNSDKAIDYGSIVEPGTVLAKIDDALYTAEVQLARSAMHQSQHQLRNAESGVVKAQADLRRAEADLLRLQSVAKQADQQWKRTEGLFKNKVVGDQEYELAETAMTTAKAQLAVGEATIEQAKASLDAAKIAVGESQSRFEGTQALLSKAEKNLDYTTIRSPIRGVIVDRRVNIGQTVVSNLNAPSLFLIAKDLRKLEVWASVNEADIGVIAVGMPVEFTVDAFPNEVFHGNVKQVRLNASMTQSVVTYTVVVGVDNTSGKLLPYLTANVRFIVAQKSRALAIPGAAARWKPKPEQIAEGYRSRYAPTSGKNDKASKAGGPSKTATPPNQATVWVVDGSFVKPIDVTIGIADANFIEVTSTELTEGTEIVVGEQAAARKQTKNPFAPSIAGGIEK